MVVGCLSPHIILTEESTNITEIQEVMLMTAYPLATYHPQTGDLAQLRPQAFAPKGYNALSKQITMPLVERAEAGGFDAYQLTCTRRFRGANMFKLCQLANTNRQLSMHSDAKTTEFSDAISKFYQGTVSMLWPHNLYSHRRSYCTHGQYLFLLLLMRGYRCCTLR